MAFTTANFLIMYNNGKKQRQLAIIFNLSLPLVESNICDVNKKENNNITIERKTH